MHTEVYNKSGCLQSNIAKAMKETVAGQGSYREVATPLYGSVNRVVPRSDSSLDPK
jgi:hypothetical protein